MPRLASGRNRATRGPFAGVYPAPPSGLFRRRGKSDQKTTKGTFKFTLKTQLARSLSRATRVENLNDVLALHPLYRVTHEVCTGFQTEFQLQVLAVRIDRLRT